MPEAAWQQLHPAVKAGGRLWTYGVPNGVRGSFFRQTRNAAWLHVHWPRSYNPGMSSADMERIREALGGRSSPAYIHNVLGVFCESNDLAFPAFASALVPLSHPYGETDVVVASAFGDGLGSRRPVGATWMGVDLGFSDDPTEIVLWEDVDAVFSPWYRYHLVGVPYDRQASIIGKLAEVWHVDGIGVDAGGPGLPVVHMLCSPPAKVLVTPVWFQGWVNWSPPGVNMPMRGTLKAMVSAAMAADMFTGRVLFSERDLKRQEEYGQHTVGQTNTGRTTFSKGNDHVIDADRCAYFVAHPEMFAYSLESPYPEFRAEGFGCVANAAFYGRELQEGA